jgi:hypothetical protein
LKNAGTYLLSNYLKTEISTENAKLFNKGLTEVAKFKQQGWNGIQSEVKLPLHFTEPLEMLQAINLAVKTLSEIENLSIDDSVKNKLTGKVLETIEFVN